MASTGQTRLQVPQSTHLFGSMTALPSLSKEMASTGQELTHIPQPTQIFLFTFIVSPIVKYS